jgi:hypothetical protein
MMPCPKDKHIPFAKFAALGRLGFLQFTCGYRFPGL